MAQTDLYHWLRNQRLSGNHDYFSISDVYEAMGEWKPTGSTPEKRALWRQIKQLQKFGFIEVKGIGSWPSFFRLKEKYIKKDTKGSH